jgi:hypothetical protein
VAYAAGFTPIPAPTAAAQTVDTWVGPAAPAGASWSIATNWSTLTVPINSGGTTYAVVEPDNKLIFYDVVSPATISGLTMSGFNSVIQYTAPTVSLTVTGPVSSFGTIQVIGSGASFTATATSSAGAYSGAYLVSAGGTVTLGTNAYRADYQDYRANRIMLSADGPGTLLSVSNATSFNGAAFGGSGAWAYTVQAINGGLVDLSNVASVVGSPAASGGGDDVLQFLIASGGTVRLDHLTTLSGSTRFDLQNVGSTFNLPLLVSATTTQFNLPTSGVLNVPALMSLASSSVSLPNGATANANALNTLSASTLTIAGGAAFNATSLASIDGSTINLAAGGATLNVPSLLSLTHSTLFLPVGSTFVHGAVSSVDYSLLSVSNGVNLTLPNVPSYRADFADLRANTVLLSASGNGAVLAMSNMATVNGAAYGLNGAFTYTVQAINGGLVDLSNVSSVVGPLGANGLDDALQFLVASGGTIRLDHLATLSGNTRFDLQNAGSTFSLPALATAANTQFNLPASGTLNVQVLFSLSGSAVNLPGGATFNAPAMNSLSNSSLSLAGGAAFSATALATIANSTITLNGAATLNVPSLISLTNTDLALVPGSTFVHGPVSSADLSALSVSGSMTLSLPNLLSYHYDAQDLRTNKPVLSANGAGAVLAMSNLASLSVASYGFGAAWIYSVQASNGGLVDLSSLTSVVGSPANNGGGDDALQFLVASGGTIRLDHLTTLSGNTRFDLQAPGSTFTLPALNTAVNTQFNLPANGTLNVPVLASLSGSAISIPGGATLNAPAMNSLAGSSLSISGGGAFNATALASIANSTITLNGAATLNLPSLVALTNTDLALIPGTTFVHGPVTSADLSALSVSGSTVLSLPNLLSYHYDAQDLRVNKPLLSANGAGAVLALSNVASLSVASYGFGGAWMYGIQAINGGLVDLSNLTSVIGAPATNGGGDDSLQFLSASGGTIRLDHLATLSGNTRFDLQSPGSTYTLPALAIAASAQFNLPANGTLNLPVLASLSGSAVSVPGGAAFNAPAMTAVSTSSLSVSGGGAFNATALATIANSTITLSGAATLNLPSLASLTNTDLTLPAGATLIHGPVSNVDFSALSVSGGASLTLPSVLSYHNDLLDFRANKALLSADGAGSALSMSNLASINSASYGFGGAWLYTIQAINGGLLDLSGLTTVSGSPLNNGGGDDALRFLIASGGTIRLDHLSTLSGNTRFDIQVPTYTLPSLSSAVGVQFNLSASGVLNLPALRSLSGSAVNLPGGATFNANAMTSFAGGSISVAGGAVFNATSLGSVDSTTVALSGSATLNFPSLLAWTNTDLALPAGSTFIHGPVSNVDFSALSISGGASLTLPNVSSYHNDLLDFRANKALLSADGAGSVLSLPNLATINSASYGFGGAWLYSVQAINGGLVDLSNLASASGSPLNNGGGDDALRFLIASGGTIRLDHLSTLSGNTRFDFQVPTYTLPSLSSAAGVQFNLSASGVLNVPALRSLSASSVNLPGGATFNGNAMTSFAGGSISVAGGAAFNATSLASVDSTTVTLSGSSTLKLPSLLSWTNTDLNLPAGGTFIHGPVSNIDLSALSVSNGVTLSLPNVLSYRIDLLDFRANKALLSASGPGAVLSVPNLSSLSSASYGFSGQWTYSVQAINGGVVDLSGLRTINGSPTNNGNGDDILQFQAASGGTLRLDSFGQTSGRVSFLASGGTMIVGQPIFNPGALVTINSNGVIQSLGDVKFKAGGTASLSGGGVLLVGGSLLNEVTNSASFAASAGTLQFTGGGIHTMELSGHDSGAVDPGNNGNFGFAQMIVGQSAQPATVLELTDSSDNGNRGTNGLPEALYLFGSAGTDGLHLLANSQLVIYNLNVYTKIGGVWTSLQGLFSTNQTSIPFDGGFITRTAQGWDVDASGNWLTAANWFNSGLPNGIGAAAIFGARISAPRTVTVTNAVTVGAIQFDNANPYTITGGATINLQNTGSTAATVRTDQINGHGDQTIAAPLNVVSNVNFINNSTATLTISGLLGNPLGRTLTKTGPGTLIVSGPQAHGVGSVMDVEAGTLVLNSDAGSPGSAPLNLISHGGTTRLNVQQHLGSLNVTGGHVSFQAGVGTMHSVGAITLTGGLTDVNHDQLLTSTSPSAIKAYLASDYTPDQDWSGTGLASSLAITNPTKYSVAYASGSDASAQDAGVPVAPGQVLVKAVLTGDANMDGTVDFFDIVQVLGYRYNAGGNNASYTDGDLDYSGSVDFFDIVTILSANYNSGEVLASPEVAERTMAGVSSPQLVPEPGSLSLLTLGAAGVLCRRRRRGRRSHHTTRANC